jgi:hypothetical protein
MQAQRYKSLFMGTLVLAAVTAFYHVPRWGDKLRGLTKISFD